MTHVREIIKAKGSTVWTISPQDTVKKALIFMAEKNVGAVLVLEGKDIVGVFSERDFARHSAKSNLRPEEVPVKDIMTTRILFVSPSETTEDCMSLMTAKRIRHLPVIENDQLIGLISIGDVVNKIIEDHKFSITQLEHYVTGKSY
ncbi:MAG: CBS domain-containing protein [Candidatus Omnitrophota bacterium]